MKTESKHTPAPWHVNTLENPIRTIHATRGHVATVASGTMGEVSADEIEANARLIAAAPQLLAALRGLLAVESARFKLPTYGLADGVELSDLSAALAAIEKAEGQI